MRVDIWLDITCPWSYIGLVRLKRLADVDGDVQIIHRPYQLRPTLGREGADLYAALRKRHGREPEAVFAPIHALAAEDGLNLDLTRQRHLWPTQAAHHLVQMGTSAGQRHGLLVDLYRANFDEAADIADPDLLADIGARNGISDVRNRLDDPEARRAHRAILDLNMRMGLQAVPFYVFGQELSVSGCESYDLLSRALRRTREAEQRDSDRALELSPR